MVDEIFLLILDIYYYLCTSRTESDKKHVPFMKIYHECNIKYICMKEY